jgi:inositol oxygenase
MDTHAIHTNYFPKQAVSSPPPNKDQHAFRQYTNEAIHENIKQTYKLARQHQSVEHVRAMHTKYLTFEHQMPVQTVFDELSTFVDISDPDISLPNFYHGIQTAESIRKDGHPEWLQVVGLVHDIGKIMYKWGCDEDGTTINKQWGIVGDTFVVGCPLPDSLVYPEFNTLHPDNHHAIYHKTKHGMYEANCGLDDVLCSWGHDEYLYQVLKHNQCNLPEEALYIIRFHSLYAHHRDNAYPHLMNKKDHRLLHRLKLFNEYDLYTKDDTDSVLSTETTSYYDGLVRKYLNGGQLWL